MSGSNVLDTTIGEWRAEMERLEAGAPGKTEIELCEELKMPGTTMKRRLKKLMDSGLCRRAIGTRVGVSGRKYPVSVYQLKKAGEK